MELTDELEKLDDFLKRGVINHEEFHQLKSSLIRNLSDSRLEEKRDPSTNHLEAIERQNELARIDREWEIDREKFYVRGEYGNRDLPTKLGGLLTAFFVGGFGAIWTLLAFGLTSAAPDFMPFSIAKVVFPLLGVIFTVGGIFSGLNCVGKAIRYEQAHEEYQLRRSEFIDTRS